MSIFTKISLPIISLLLLTGCGTNNKEDLDQFLGSKKEIDEIDEIIEYDIVQMVTDDSILVGATYYEVSESTELVKSGNQPLSFEELKPGDLVILEDTGFVMESFPGQGFATSVTLQEDEESLKVSKKLKYFLENQKTGDILAPNIQELTDESILLHFLEREIHGKKYEARIDRFSNEFTVKEIPNEEAIEQERRRKEFAAANPQGSTAGHITEIYDDGFRINMADYTFSDDIQFSDDLGNQLTKDQFLIGSFVGVDYDKIESNAIVSEGVLSKLTLISKEEDTKVRKWIESIITGDLYLEPVIMQSYIDNRENSYTIVVADLKDDTWDTFALTFDKESETFSTKRIPHK